MPGKFKFAAQCGSLCLALSLLWACSGGDSSDSSSASASASSSSASNVAAPVELSVPTLAYDDTSITLSWKKPSDYSNIADYNVYLNGIKLGSASANASLTPVKSYIDAFYAADTANFHTKVHYLSYTATGLKPDTSYTFTVRAVDASGNESADSVALTQKTAASYSNIVNIATAGALGDGSTVNTTVIQNAIDSCAAASTSAYGCKVLVPANAASGKVFVTGALFLKSNMTLEIAEGATLRASAAASDFPLSKGYQLYSFFTNTTDDRRPPSLLNLLSTAHMNGSTALADHQGYDETRGVFSNVRIVGKGVLDGNGWNRLSDITDEASQALPQYAAGSASTYNTLGVLAKSQMAAAVAEMPSGSVSNLYSNRRSSLTTFRGVKNIYLGGLTLRNPAYHGVMFIESENIVFANTISQSYDVNNGDGVEFGNSDNAMVFNNFFDTGDDDVNFAAGQGKDYENKPPQQNARIFNNYMREGHGAVVAGSHTGAWIQDILAEDNVMYHTDNGLRMKSTPATGGGARRVVFRDNAMKDMSTNAFIFTLAYSAGSNVFSNASASAQFRDITIKNVTLDNISAGGAPILVDGYAGTDTTLGYAETFQENIVFDTVKISNAKVATSISRLKNSSFKDVTVTNSPASFWVISNSSGNTFSNVSPAP
ncbi:glycoside hydrolase family 28 protein [Uliginosibacterium sediminicola]|uniref:Glycoside hydrolase family 28 protein n=1 Tax=Uliginosibacterium sediminicola TaxID=2024550 RepID=A0ABU9YYA1_9RHOO